MSLRCVRLLGLAIIFSFLCSCARRHATGDFSLVEHFPQARLGPVLAHNGNLPDYRIVPYLGSGWKFTPGEHLDARGSAEFHYFLLYPADVRIILEARGEGSAALKLNGSPLGTVRLGREWGTHTFEVSSAQMGLNRISIVEASGSQWRACRVEPVHGLSPARVAKAQQDSLYLPFGQTVDYGFSAPQGGRFHIERVKPWLEPGAPVPEGWSLTLTMADRQHKISPAGETRLAFPAATRQTLSLASHAASPLPGQIGVEIVGPRISGLSRIADEPPAAPSPTVSRRPNVLIFLVDTLRADRLGCYGYARPTSPEIDAFSRDAVLFENAMAQASWTLPSVTSIFTSKLPHQHGVTDFPHRLSADNVCLAEVLSAQGYRSGAFFANLLLWPESGLNQGFSTYTLSKDARAEEIVSAGVSWLKQARNGPFFLYLHVLEPHAPHQPAREFRSKFAPGAGEVHYYQEEQASRASFWEGTEPKPNRRMARDRSDLYDAEVAGVSAAFGRLVEELKELDLYDDTLIFFVSDHGEELLDHGSFGHIHSLYQELLHIPLMVKYPGRRHAGLRSSRVVQHIDIGPTVFQELGLDPLEGSGLPLTPGPAAPEVRPVLFSTNAGWDDERYRDWLYAGVGVRLGFWTLLRTEASALNRFQPLELYDLQSDPEQRRNLVLQRPEVALYLSSFLDPAQLGKTDSGSSRKAAPRDDVLRGLQYIR